jgi:universal stress protein A
MLRLQTILHPTDFSPDSDNAFHMACSLARDHGARIVLVHVHQPAETMMGEFGMVPPPPEDLGELQAKLDALRPAAPEVPVERELCEGDPMQQILAAARESHCDLIVMGTHGHSALYDALLGSVAEQVVRKAPCAVLTLRAPRS